MAILWCGGEPVDFPIGPPSELKGVNETNRYRSQYSRGYLYPPVAQQRISSLPFVGGAVTSLWCSFICSGDSWSSGSHINNAKLIGLTNSIYF